MADYTVKGFDVASVNRDNRGRRIDWRAVGAAKEVDFCGIRVLDGSLDDLDGEYNCNGAASIGLPFLPYQPFYPRVDAKLQARLFAGRVKFQYPLVRVGRVKRLITGKRNESGISHFPAGKTVISQITPYANL